jgi:polyribonucleotide nucleotidyltransferase
MEKGHGGINRILDIMEQVISEPRTEKANWPVSEKLDVTITKRGKFIGPGGINIKKLLSETGVQVISSTEDAGSFTLFAPNAEAMSEAKEIIDKLLTEERVPELTFGAIYKAKITEILDRGVFVQLHPEMQPVLISNSQLDAKKVIKKTPPNWSSNCISCFFF